MPEGELDLSRQGVAALPDLRGGQGPDITHRVYFRVGDIHELPKPHETEGQKDEHHPGRGDIGELGYGLIAECRHHRNESPYHGNGDHPTDTGRIEVIEARHGDIEPDAYGGRRDGDHGAGQEAEHHAVGQVVEDHQVATADLFQLVVEGQSDTGGNGCTDEYPAQDGQRVAQQQSHNQVKGTRARGDKEGANHQFGTGAVFARIHADETLEAQVGLGRHRLAFEFTRGRLSLLCSFACCHRSLPSVIGPLARSLTGDREEHSPAFGRTHQRQRAPTRFTRSSRQDAKF